MSMSTVVKKIIDNKIDNLSVAFLAKILSVSGNKAKIQPLGLTKGSGDTVRKQAVLTGVHISSSAKYKFSTTIIEGKTVAAPTPIQKGDVVLCVCCDRNIDAALKGENSLPPAGCHNKSDCVIVAII